MQVKDNDSHLFLSFLLLSPFVFTDLGQCNYWAQFRVNADLTHNWPWREGLRSQILLSLMKICLMHIDTDPLRDEVAVCAYSRQVDLQGTDVHTSWSIHHACMKEL